MQRLSLQQKLQQKLSPQQIQLMKLLEIPTLQLEQRIKKELEENPTLEQDADDLLPDNSGVDNDGGEYASTEDEFSADNYLHEDDIPSYQLRTNNYSSENKDIDTPLASSGSFSDYLKEQLSVSRLTEEELMIADYIIGNIDDDGYLRRDIESVVDDLSFKYGLETTDDKAEKVLKYIQRLDPAGVGARDLQECLLLQLVRCPSSPEVDRARRVVDEMFDLLAKRHFEKIERRLKLKDEDELKEVIDVIQHLTPKPGGTFNVSDGNTEQITPDFILDNVDGELILKINGANSPNLRVNTEYAKMLEEFKKKRAAAKEKKNSVQEESFNYVKRKIDEAQWFIDALNQRNQTLMVTMSQIIDFQKEYFLTGDEAKLKPMVLKTVAETTGLDISTISRVSNSKYIQTYFGTYPVKYFFSEGIMNDDGEEISSRKIKSILQECVNNEDKKKPLTDEKLTEILKEQNFNIARRTVAKYREQLDIPVARLRKEL
ncbi:MAG: RNA polymerase factor sigma-54 [Bacteroidales bacterium]